MIDQLIEKIKTDNNLSERFLPLFREKEISARTVLLKENQISGSIFFIREGCLRMWFNKDGKDITIQFFFENQAVASIESFMTGQPGMFYIESIEPCRIIEIKKKDFYAMLEEMPDVKEGFNHIMFRRFSNYARLFLSRIKDTPAERYNDLIQNHPEIIRRVPQHYIASYLGITPISLSRIRNRK